MLFKQIREKRKNALCRDIFLSARTFVPSEFKFPSIPFDPFVSASLSPTGKPYLRGRPSVLLCTAARAPLGALSNPSRTQNFPIFIWTFRVWGFPHELVESFNRDMHHVFGRQWPVKLVKAVCRFAVVIVPNLVFLPRAVPGRAAAVVVVMVCDFGLQVKPSSHKVHTALSRCWRP